MTLICFRTVGGSLAPLKVRNGCGYGRTNTSDAVQIKMLVLKSQITNIPIRPTLSKCIDLSIDLQCLTADIFFLLDLIFVNFD